MKVCAACHTDLPKESYSKKQWKLDEYQRRCKLCITNNQEVQPSSNNNNTTDDGGLVTLLDSISLDNTAKKNISDEELFKQPPPLDDCPICLLRMPSLDTGKRYH